VFELGVDTEEQLSYVKLTPSLGTDAKRIFRANEDISISDVGRVERLSISLIIAGDERSHYAVSFNQIWLRRYFWTEVDFHKVVAVDNKSQHIQNLQVMICTILYM